MCTEHALIWVYNHIFIAAKNHSTLVTKQGMSTSLTDLSVIEEDHGILGSDKKKTRFISKLSKYVFPHMQISFLKHINEKWLCFVGRKNLSWLQNVNEDLQESQT